MDLTERYEHMLFQLEHLMSQNNRLEDRLCGILQNVERHLRVLSIGVTYVANMHEPELAEVKTLVQHLRRGDGGRE